MCALLACLSYMLNTGHHCLHVTDSPPPFTPPPLVTFDNYPYAPPAPPLMGATPNGVPGFAALSNFPYCDCQTYACQNSPYRMNYLNRVVVSSTLVSLDFQLFKVSGQLVWSCLCELMLWSSS